MESDSTVYWGKGVRQLGAPEDVLSAVDHLDSSLWVSVYKHSM